VLCLLYDGCSEQQSRFYATQVALGLEYMQFMDLVYRDLKPENILINVNGYLKVTRLAGVGPSVVLSPRLVIYRHTRYLCQV